MTLAEEFVAGFDTHNSEAMLEAVSWSVEIEDMDEDGLFFFHFGDGSIAGVKKTETVTVWVVEDHKEDDKQ
jgi:hypothetical protein